MENLNLNWKDDILFVSLQFELTHERIPEFKALIDSEMNSRPFSTLVLDLSHVDFLDSSGISFLLACNTRLTSSGKNFCLLRPSGAVRKTLGLVQLLGFFKTAEQENELPGIQSA